MDHSDTYGRCSYAYSILHKTSTLPHEGVVIIADSHHASTFSYSHSSIRRFFVHYTTTPACKMWIMPSHRAGKCFYFNLHFVSRIYICFYFFFLVASLSHTAAFSSIIRILVNTSRTNRFFKLCVSVSVSLMTLFLFVIKFHSIWWCNGWSNNSDSNDCILL